MSVETNWLIKTGQAQMWVPNESMSRDTKKGDLYTMLQNEILTIDELVRKTGRSAEDLGAELTMMTLRGEVVEREGKYYVND